MLSLTDGVVACAVAVPKLGKLVLFSNNGSLYLGHVQGGIVFSSERYPLKQIGAESITQITDAVVIEIPIPSEPATVAERRARTADLVPGLGLSVTQERLLDYHNPS